MSKKSYLGKMWFSLVVSLSGILVVAYFIYQLNHSLIERIKNSEIASFQNASFLLKEKMESFVHGLESMNGVYLATHFNPSVKTIRAYALNRHFFKNFPGAIGFGFVRKVNNIELSQYVKQRKLTTNPFSYRKIGPLNLKDSFVSEVFEPIETHEAGLGVDLGSEKNRREAAEKAMDTGEAVLTSPIIFVSTKRLGFLFFLPLYNSPGHLPLTIEERREKLVGWANAPILVSGLIAFLEKSVDAHLVLEMKDSQDGIIHRDDRAVDDRYKNSQNWMQKSLYIGGRTWILRGAVVPNKNVFLINLFSIFIFLVFSCSFVLFIWKFRKVVTEKESSEIRTKEIESWQSAVLNGSYYSMISTLPDGTISTFNKAAEKLIGYSAHELIGKHNLGLFHDPQEITSRALILSEELNHPVQVGFDTFVAKAREIGPDTNEWTYIHKSGKRTPVRLCVTALKTDDGQILGYLGVAEDLTDIKRIQEIVQKQRVVMISTAKMAALGEMAGGVAHEINNPLSIITGRTTVMRSMSESGILDSESLNEGLTKIDETCERIAKIVLGLRTFSRDSTKDPMIVFPISKIIESTLDLCHQRLLNHDIKLEVVINTEAKLLCHPVQMSQVLMNLIGNAVDAIDLLSEKWITIKIESFKKEVIISVTDSGKGIDPHVVQRMMEPFFTTKDAGRGTGLGLSISKGIIEGHHGHLSYGLYQGHTQFLIKFPLST